MTDFPIQITLDPTVQYAMDCVGGATMFACAWWVFVRLVRNGIDGGKRIARVLREHRFWREVGEGFIGHWRPLRDSEPIRPATPTLWDTWQSMD